jgi:ABC-type multidrug transport system fused ATPase/permease subunit
MNDERKDDSREKVVELCKKLNLHDKIMSLEQQYETLVGEQGAKFSGGER